MFGGGGNISVPDDYKPADSGLYQNNKLNMTSQGAISKQMPVTFVTEIASSPPSPRWHINVNKICINTYRNVLSHIEIYYVLMPLSFFFTDLPFRYLFGWCWNSKRICSRGFFFMQQIQLLCDRKELSCTRKDPPRQVNMKEMNFRNIYEHIHWVINKTVSKPSLVTHDRFAGILLLS